MATLSVFTMPSPIPAGLVDAIHAAGYRAQLWNGAWVGDNPTAIETFISSYNALPATQAEAIATVEAQLAAKIAAGFTYNGNSISIDDAHQGKLSRSSALASSIQAGLVSQTWSSTRVWPTLNGSSIAVGTTQAMLALASAAAHYVMDLEEYALTASAQIQAATSVSEVQSIISGLSWPTS